MKKILICDDDENIREILEMLISIDFDVEFVHAENGLEGIDCLKNHENIDLIICDKNMPKARGIEVFHFNESNKKLPFILLSGDGDAATDEFINFTLFKHCRLVSKPWKEEELIDTLKDIIAA